MVRWLMATNPDDRPSAREVLRSEVLPPTVGDEQLTDLLRSLPDKWVLHCHSYNCTYGTCLGTLAIYLAHRLATVLCALYRNLHLQVDILVSRCRIGPLPLSILAAVVYTPSDPACAVSCTHLGTFVQ